MTPLHLLLMMNMKIFLYGLLFVAIMITIFITHTMMHPTILEKENLSGLYHQK